MRNSWAYVHFWEHREYLSYRPVHSLFISKTGQPRLIETDGKPKHETSAGRNIANIFTTWIHGPKSTMFIPESITYELTFSRCNFLIRLSRKVVGLSLPKLLLWQVELLVIDHYDCLTEIAKISTFLLLIVCSVEPFPLTNNLLHSLLRGLCRISHFHTK